MHVMELRIPTFLWMEGPFFLRSLHLSESASRCFGDANVTVGLFVFIEVSVWI